MRSPITISPNTISHQAAHCWLYMQIGYTAVLGQWFGKMRFPRQLQIFLAAPKHDPETGYSRTKWGMRVRPRGWY